MKFSRELITPFIAGTCLLSAVTGLLLFFHIDMGAIKWVHEWLSWAFLFAVACHAMLNFPLLKKHLLSRQGALIMGLSLMLLALSIVPMGKKAAPPFLVPIRAMAQLPFTTLAQVAQTSPQDLMDRLSAAGLHPVSEQQKLTDLTGNNLRQQMRVLTIVLSNAKTQP